MLKRMLCIWMGDRGRWQIVNIWQGRDGNSWAIKHRDEYININPCFKVCWMCLHPSLYCPDTEYFDMFYFITVSSNSGQKDNWPPENVINETLLSLLSGCAGSIGLMEHTCLRLSVSILRDCLKVMQSVYIWPFCILPIHVPLNTGESLTFPGTRTQIKENNLILPEYQYAHQFNVT